MYNNYIQDCFSQYARLMYDNIKTSIKKMKLLKNIWMKVQENQKDMLTSVQLICTIPSSVTRRDTDTGLLGAWTATKSDSFIWTTSKTHPHVTPGFRTMAAEHAICSRASVVNRSCDLMLSLSAIIKMRGPFVGTLCIEKDSYIYAI